MFVIFLLGWVGLLRLPQSEYVILNKDRQQRFLACAAGIAALVPFCVHAVGEFVPVLGQFFVLLAGCTAVSGMSLYGLPNAEVGGRQPRRMAQLLMPSVQNRFSTISIIVPTY